MESLNFDPSTQIQKDKIHSVQFQHQIMQFFGRLLRKYPNQYPKLIVSIRFLQEHKGLSDDDYSSISNDNRTMMQLRHIRDTALEKGERECTRVHRLIQIAHDCFLILVPRFGSSDSNPAGWVGSNSNTSSMQQDLEYDSLDWEDGDDDQSDMEMDHDDRSYMEMDHSVAVDRTLHQMSARGTFMDGKMCVDMNHAATMDHPTQSRLSNTEKAKDTLNKCVASLSNRHLPRIMTWMNALQNVDSLTNRIWDGEMSKKIQGNSWVLLPDMQRKKKYHLLSRFMILRQDIVSVIRLAGNVGVVSMDTSDVSSFAIGAGLAHLKNLTKPHIHQMIRHGEFESAGNHQIHDFVKRRKNVERIRIKLL
jgi:hypothetical protein